MHLYMHTGVVGSLDYFEEVRKNGQQKIIAISCLSYLQKSGSVYTY